jgi:hypothetical protein
LTLCFFCVSISIMHVRPAVPGEFEKERIPNTALHSAGVEPAVLSESISSPDLANVNRPAYGLDQNPANQPGSDPFTSSYRPVDDGGKPRRQTGEGGQFSDKAYQDTFTNVAPGPAPQNYRMPSFRDTVPVLDADGRQARHQRTGKRQWQAEPRVVNGQIVPITNEEIVSRYVDFYLSAAHKKRIDPERLERALIDYHERGGRAGRKFYKALGAAATRHHVTAQSRAGRSPWAHIKDPVKDSVIPVAVQEKVQILPGSLRDRLDTYRMRQRYAKLKHAGAMQSRYSGTRDSMHPGLKRDRLMKKADRRRNSKLRTADHHHHHIDHSMEHFAFSKGRKLSKAASRVVKKYGNETAPQESLHTSTARTSQHRTGNSLVDSSDRARIAREAASRK